MQSTTIEISSSLSPEEIQQLAELEDRIRAGLKSIIEAGRCLMEVRDLRLYRADYKSFQEYCQHRWEMTPQYGNRLIAASCVIQNLESETNVSLLPENEIQCRPLASLPVQQQTEVWLRLISEVPKEEITGRLVEEAVQTLRLENDRNLCYHRATEIYVDFLSENPDSFGKKIKVSQVFQWLEKKGKPLPERQQALLKEDIQVYLEELEESSPIKIEPAAEAERKALRKALETASTLASYSGKELADGLCQMGGKYVAAFLIELLPAISEIEISEIENRQQAEELMKELYRTADKLNDFFGFDE